MDEKNVIVSNKDDDFDGEKILSEYETITKEEAIKLLGDEYAPILSERINAGNISYEEFEQICIQAIAKYPQRANWIKSIIYNKLSNYERLSMAGVESSKIEMMVHMDKIKKKAQNGTLSQSELKELCDITFEKDSKESNYIYEIMSSHVLPDINEEYTELETKKK